MLQGIIEADETYIGGKPRKENKKKDPERCYVYNYRNLEYLV